MWPKLNSGFKKKSMFLKCVFVYLENAPMRSGASVWPLGGLSAALWPWFLLLLTLCERFVLIQTDKRHLISPHEASLAPPPWKRLNPPPTFLFPDNKLKPGFTLNKAVPKNSSLYCSIEVLQLCFLLYFQGKCFFLLNSASLVFVSVCSQYKSPTKASRQSQKQKVRNVNTRLLLLAITVVN